MVNFRKNQYKSKLQGKNCILAANEVPIPLYKQITWFYEQSL